VKTFQRWNREEYEKEKKFISGIDFSKWINNEFIPNNLGYVWILAMD